MTNGIVTFPGEYRDYGKLAGPGWLFLQASRQWLDDRRNWHLISRAFRDFLGDEAGTTALSAFDLLMGHLVLQARRALYVRPLEDPGIGLDEMLLIEALAACDAGLDWKARMILTALLPEGADLEAEREMTRLAGLFRAAGHPFASLSHRSPVRDGETFRDYPMAAE